MQAEAIDIRLPGVATSAVRDAALRLRRGGVGYYRDSNFMQVDVGTFAAGGRFIPLLSRNRQGRIA